MAVTTLIRPSTNEVALTNAYLANDLEFYVGDSFSIESDDTAIDLTVLGIAFKRSS